MKNKNLAKLRCGIIEKEVPSLVEIFKYEYTEHKQELEQSTIEKINYLLNEGYRNFTVTLTPRSLLVAEYIAQQKKKHFRFQRIQLQLINPHKEYIPYFNINLNHYPSTLSVYNTITILSPDFDKNIIINSFNTIKKYSDLIVEI